MTSIAAPALPATLRPGAVHLTVSDLERSLAFYTDALGLRLHRRDDGAAALGAGEEDVLVLTEARDARPAGRHAGLYHVALLYPSRAELARAAVRLADRRTLIEGASDHGTHEAIYLADPDGNGLELAADRPRAQWPDLRTYVGGPRALDVPDLLGVVADEAPTDQVGPGLRVGHVHLHVGDLDAAVRFYRDVLGFELMTALPSAAFLAAGGYHHHVAVNVWRGRGVPPAPADAVGLRHWTIVLPDEADVAAVRDRVEAAGIPVEERPGGFLVRDPSDIALAVQARS
jgi:catechol 2,3-dioxygenase